MFVRLQEADAEGGATAPRAARRLRFDHLDGCRTLMTLWVASGEGAGGV